MKFNFNSNKVYFLEDLQTIYKRWSSPDGSHAGWGDKGNAHSYIDEYAKYLAPYRFDSNFLEIGIYWGDSLMMWDEYFENSNIYGLDIDDRHINAKYPNHNFKIAVADSSDISALKYYDGIEFDVIIDDGNHEFEYQKNTFMNFRRKMKTNGIYVIEDIGNIDESRDEFLKLHDNCTIIDNRHLPTGDVMVIYRF